MNTLRDRAVTGFCTGPNVYFPNEWPITCLGKQNVSLAQSSFPLFPRNLFSATHGTEIAPFSKRHVVGWLVAASCQAPPISLTLPSHLMTVRYSVQEICRWKFFFTWRGIKMLNCHFVALRIFLPLIVIPCLSVTWCKKFIDDSSFLLSVEWKQL